MSEENKNVLEEKLNPEYPDGLQELADVLDFLPENARLGTAAGFLGLMLAN